LIREVYHFDFIVGGYNEDDYTDLMSNFNRNADFNCVRSSEVAEVTSITQMVDGKSATVMVDTTV
jgi:hypothetical protein